MNVLLSYPNEEVPPRIELLDVDDSVLYTVNVTESDESNEPLFNGYSGSGNCEGADLVFAGYGSPEEFAELKAKGISVRGAVALVRYGHGFRGNKAAAAQAAGACGCLIYSDPANYKKGTAYPNGR